MMKLEKLEKYVKETTDLVIEPYEHGLVVTGSFGKFNISLTITWWWSDNGAYTCNGGIYVKEDYLGVELIEVSKTLKNEEEIIYLIQSMTSTCIGIMEYLRRQREFLNL
jgi:hypothetical protein